MARKLKSPAAILKAARKTIEEGRWRKNTLASCSVDGGGGCYCALGAVANATGLWDCKVDESKGYDLLEKHDGARAAVRLLAESVPKASRLSARTTHNDPSNPRGAQTIVYEYNDTHSRRRADVVELFDRAIARAEGR